MEPGFIPRGGQSLKPRKHGRGTRGAAPASDAARRGCPRVGPRLRFFFFFSRIRADSARFAPMRLDSCRIGFDSHRIGLIRHESSHIGANRAESARIREKKIKKRRRGPTRRQLRRTPRPASRHVRRGCSTSGAASVLSSLQGSSGISYATFTIVS